ncbi:MAG: hypothetical protein ACLT4Y_10230 [Bifidobacterium breve]
MAAFAPVTHGEHAVHAPLQAEAVEGHHRVDPANCSTCAESLLGQHRIVLSQICAGAP